MKVRATREGYYGVARIREGEVFELKSHMDFSERWMAEVSRDEPESIDPDTGALRVPRSRNKLDRFTR